MVLGGSALEAQEDDPEEECRNGESQQAQVWEKPLKQVLPKRERAKRECKTTKGQKSQKPAPKPRVSKSESRAATTKSQRSSRESSKVSGRLRVTKLNESRKSVFSTERVSHSQSEAGSVSSQFKLMLANPSHK